MHSQRVRSALDATINAGQAQGSNSNRRNRSHAQIATDKYTANIQSIPVTLPSKNRHDLVTNISLKQSTPIPRIPSAILPLYRQIAYTHSLYPTNPIKGKDDVCKSQEQVHQLQPNGLPLPLRQNCIQTSIPHSTRKILLNNCLIPNAGSSRILSQRLLNKEEKSVLSKINYFKHLISDEMGWSQPIVGKRVRPSESDENENNGTTTDASSSTEDLKANFNKKPREISPKRSPGIMDFNNETNFQQQRVPLMTMGCELSNRASSSDANNPTANISSGCTATTSSSETETCQSSSISQYSIYNTRPEPTRRKSREKSGGDDNTNLKTFSIEDEISTTATCTSQEEVDSLYADVSSETMPTAVRGVRVSRKGPRVTVAARSGSNGVRGISRKDSSLTSSTSDTSTTCEGSNSATEPTSEATSEANDLETDYEDKTDDLVEDEAEDLSDSTDYMPPFQTPTKVLPAIRPSYFPYVPPYINFCLHNEQCEPLPTDIRKYLKWKLSPITPNVIKKTVNNTGFRLLRKTVEWDGQWGKHMKAALFRSSLKDYQKLNHLPATFQIGRKDRLWRNFHRFMLKFGREEFGFLPRTYILPQEIKQLKQAWDATESKGKPWIVKPPAAARGTGIRVVNRWVQVPKKRPVVVQKYISNPLLINERKFDLRLYVLVTSFHPLKVYLYNDGLVRFAPVKYTQDSKRVSDRYMHLTNYSVNKNCELYTQNEDADSCKGHKWTLKTLWRHMRTEGINVDAIWEQIEDIVIKTLLCAEDSITAASYSLPNRYNGYELFGFDIILDHKLKPWLLEVNISPSLHSSSPLDLAVKGELVKEVFNIVGYHLPSTLPPPIRKLFVGSLDISLEQDTPVFDKRLYSGVISKDEKFKHQNFKAIFEDRQKYLYDITKTLTPDDIRQLITAEDELSQCQGFTRIFPTPTSHIYFPFIEGPRYYNMLLDAWESCYHANRVRGIERIKELCQAKIHLQVTTSSKNTISESPTPTISEPLPLPLPKLKSFTLGPNGVDEEQFKDTQSFRMDGVGDEGQLHQQTQLNPSSLYSHGLSVNCHDEALATSTCTNTSPASEFLKGVC